MRGADETDAEVGDRANDAIRIAGARHPRQGGRRRRQPRRDAARPRRIRAARAAASTPTPSTIRPASTPPTSRSTSRSRSAALVRAGALDLRRPQRLPRRDDRRGRGALPAQQLSAAARASRSPSAQGVGALPDHRGADREPRSARPAAAARSSSCPTTRRSTRARTAGKGLTRPELATLLAYAKNSLYADLLAEHGARRRRIWATSCSAISRQTLDRALSRTRSPATACAAR